MIFLLKDRIERGHSLFRKRGFILLFSLLISSVILAAGLSVTRIIIRQITLASIQKDSQMAFFAADAGLECARFWKDGSSFVNNSSKCNNEIIRAKNSSGGSASTLNANNTTFFFNTGGESIDGVQSQKNCVQITICLNGSGSGECLDPQASNGKIIAKGYNSGCDANGVLFGGRLVERRLDYVYN